MATKKQKKDQPVTTEVGGLRAESYSDSIVLTWRTLTEFDSEDDPVIYQVYFKKDDQEENWQPMAGGDGIATLTGLEPNSDYCIRVQAFNDASGVLGSYPEDDEYMVVRTAPPKDVEAPAVSTTELVLTKRTRTSLYVQWQAASDNETESSQIRYEVYLDGELKTDKKGITTSSFTKLMPNTRYTVTVKAYDEAGNVLVYPDFQTKTLDDRAPSVTNPNLTVTELKTDSFTIQWEAAYDNDTPSDQIRYEVYLNGMLERNEKGIQSSTFKGLTPNTEYTFIVKAFDEADNALKYLEAAVTTPDDKAPTVSSPNLTVSDRKTDSISIQWKAASDNDTAAAQIRYEVYLNGTLKQDAKGITSYTFTGLTPNTQYTFLVKAFDKSGNVRPYSQVAAKTLDDKAPTAGIKTISIASVTRDSFKISWNAASDNDTASAQIRYEVYLNGTLKQNAKNITSYSFTGLTPNTQYAFWVKAFDEAGNALLYPEASATTLDNMAPTVGNASLTVSACTTNSITIKWNPASDNDTAASQIRYEVYLNGMLKHNAKNITSYSFTGLAPNTQYSFHVKAFDAAGNALLYPTTYVKTKDDKAPTVGNSAITISEITRNGFKASWNAASDNDTASASIRYQVKLYVGGSWVLKKEAVGITSFTFTGLTPNTQYYVCVLAIDASGNQLSYPSSGSTPAKTLDDKAPTVGNTGLTVTSRTTNSIAIKWNAASDNDTAASQIRYEVYLNGTLKQNAKNITSYTFTGLTPNTQYSFYVKAYDTANNCLTYPTVNGKTLDNKAPTVGNSAITISNITRNSFKASWAAASDNDTASASIRYQVKLKVGGTWVLKQEATGITSYTFTGLTPNTQYYVVVYAYDASGNALSYPCSGGSTPAKTLDDKAPTVGNATLTVNNRQTDAITIQWNAASDNDTSAAQIRYEVYMNGTLKQNAKNITSYKFTGLTPNTQYSFYVKAYDTANNCLTYPTVYGKTLDNKAPTVGNSTITISNRTPNSFKASWNAASDNDTASASIRYQVYLHIGGKWELKQDARGITSYTFTGLTPNTQYLVCVYAYDNANNRFIYSNGGTTSTSTMPARVNRLAVSVRQGATVLGGTNTICLDLQYSYVRYDANGNIIGRQSGNWKYKWSNKSTANTVIQLPADWYFENNKVYIYIDSRRAASAGLNKWKKCSDGWLDISSGSLILELSGSYYSYSVKFKRI